MAAPATGRVKTEVHMCLGETLVCLACVGARLSWVLGEITDRPRSILARPRWTANPSERRVRCVKMPLLSALVMWLGAELAGDEAGEVADLRRDFTDRPGALAPDKLLPWYRIKPIRHTATQKAKTTQGGV